MARLKGSKDSKKRIKASKKEMAARNLQDSAVKFIELNGGKVIVIGKIGIMQANGLYNFYLTIKFTGIKPEKSA
jgi:hypothetical protein